jgi:hypothetical protein
MAFSFSKPNKEYRDAILTLIGVIYDVTLTYFIKMNPSNPSICIPRVFNNISEERIRNVFEQLHLGKISRIDLIDRTNERGEKYKRAFIHFEYWFNTQDAFTARSKLLEKKELKIVYDNPWFWKASLSNWVQQQQHQRRPPIDSRCPHIDWEADQVQPKYKDNKQKYEQSKQNHFTAFSVNSSKLPVNKHKLTKKSNTALSQLHVPIAPGLIINPNSIEKENSEI